MRPLHWCWSGLSLPSLLSIRRLLMVALAGLLALNLAACSGATLNQATDAARAAASVAQTAANLTGNEQLKAVVTPVLNLLNSTEQQVEAGNISAASTTMQTFRSLWDTAQPVVKLAAGANYDLIDKGVKLVLNTFGGEAVPTQNTALAAVKGLIGPLTALLG
ncbi:MAG: hypothetical protein QM522_03000 [Chitinophagaceae bacterium]|nr:hypothetical protein [Chitinophagaceae bacterium]